MKKCSSFFSLLISYMILLSISLSIVSISYSGFQDTLNQTTTDYTTVILNQIKQSFDEKVTTFNKVVLDISNTSSIQTLINHKTPLSNEDIYHTSQLIKQLGQYKLLYNFIHSICVYFPNSELLISNETCYSNFDEYSTVSGYNLWSKSEFLDMLAPTSHLKYYSPPNTTDVLSVAVPFNMMRRTSNSPYIIINIHSSFLEDTLKENNVFNSYALYIFDNEDNLLFSLGENLLSKITSGISLSDVETLYTTLDPSIYSLTRVNSELLNWKYFFITPTALIPPATMNFFTTIFIFLLVALSLICCIVFTRKNYRPIQKLVSLSKQLSNMPAQSPYPTNEFDFIASSLLMNYSQHNHIREEFYKRLPDLQQQAINQLLKGTIIDWDLFQQELPSLQISFNKLLFTVVSIELVPISPSPSHLLSIATLKLKDFIHSELDSELSIHTLILSNCRLILLVNTNKEISELNLQQLHTSGTGFIKEILPCSITIGCSESVQTIEAVPMLFEHSIISLEHQLMISPGEICLYDHLPIKNHSFYYPPELESKLISHIKRGNIDEVSNLISDIIIKNIYSNELSLEASKCLFFSLMGSAIKTINLLGLNTSEIFDVDPYTRIVQCTNLPDIEVTIRESFVKLCHYISHKNTSCDTVSQNILSYIQENFFNPDLDLTLVAEHFNFSTAYLSRYIKENTGYNFMNYITEVRLTHAKYLLTHTNYTIKEVAQKCGYPNSAGLIRNFKKTFGLTPGQFKESPNH